MTISFSFCRIHNHLTHLLHRFSPQPKTTHASRLLENWSVWDFELTPVEMNAIDDMDLMKDPVFKGKRIALEWNPVDCP